MDDATHRANDTARSQWDEKASFWDQLHGQEGNSYHRTIVEPAVERLLQLQPGERVVDAACGNGTLARRLAAWGGQVTAFDFSEELLGRARARESSSPIDYRLIDGTDEAAIVELGESTFDAAVCTMALMDMAATAPLLRAIRRLLRPGARFVFVTAHPVFDTANPVRLSERRDEDGELTTRHTLKLERYVDVPATLAVGARGEPTPHLFHHRTISQLLGEAFSAGFVLDGLEEPSFPEDEDDYWQFPPAMAGRLRPA